MITIAEQRQAFHEQGYLLIPGLFSAEEVAALREEMAALRTEELVAKAGGRIKGGMVVEDAETPWLQFDIHRSGTRFDLLARHPRMAGISSPGRGYCI